MKKHGSDAAAFWLAVQNQHQQEMAGIGLQYSIFTIPVALLLLRKSKPLLIRGP
jgi:hypothetical protein